jgi:hypothetical protein
MGSSKRLLRPLSYAAAAFVSLLKAPASAQEPAAAEPATDKAACAHSFEQAQRDRNDAHYLTATKELLTCSNPRCGDAIFQECTKMYTELQEATPSIVFAARDPKNGELSDVTVVMDGQTAKTQLDGKPLLVDPGNHTFKFSAASYLPVERQILIRAGEKFRQVSVVLSPEHPEPEPAAAPPPTSGAAPVTAAISPRPRHVPVASYVLGGVGVLGIAGFALFRVSGKSDYDHLHETCVDTCPKSSVDPVRQKYLFSDIALGVGSAALVGAVLVYALQPTHSEPSVAVALGPAPGGAAASLAGRF